MEKPLIAYYLGLTIGALMMFVAIVLYQLVFGLCEKPIKSALRDQFERGAHAISTYHREFGSYGTRKYRDLVFESGDDPQDKEDIIELFESVGVMVSTGGDQNKISNP